MNPTSRHSPIYCLAFAVLLLACTTPVSIAQAPGSLSGPVLGFVFDDNDQTLRHISGIVGSSRIGSPIEVGLPLSQIEIFPDQRHAIAAPMDGSELVLLDLGTNPVSIQAIPGATGNPSQISVSPLGSSVALYYPGIRRVLIVMGASKTPVVSQSIDLSASGLPVSRIAVTDDGGMLLFGLAETGGENLYSWTAENPSRYLTSVQKIGDLAVSRTGDAVVADSASDEVFLLRDVQHLAVKFNLADHRQGVAHPIGVAISNNNEIYIANFGSGTVLAVDLSGRVLRTVDCHCAVAGIQPLRESLFLLTDRLDRAVILMDADSGGDPIVFVPALR